MAGGSKSNPPKPRKRVDAASTAAPASSLVRAKDGSAFAKCEECNKTVPVALISMHSCSLDAKIKMNLEAQVIEKPAEVKKKPAERKKPASTESNPKKPKKLKKGKDPNAPKRPPTAFFLFMDDFRKSYKEANPDAKGVTGVAKEGGEKWKSMSEEEKKPYVDKAAELKAEYEKALEEVNDADNENEDGEGSPEKDTAAAEKEAKEVLDDY
ncbi:PREDICTED: high mobility group B protein 7 [Theobroma cacao]|uniref:High mobility group B protein 7 n=1 Tax=Theobroma cacao TaxID=3641 RepID=A0AB32VIL2_THECC|nr:PREDICTED: high mobility group B protein 7 [Theobroma cacao]